MSAAHELPSSLPLHTGCALLAVGVLGAGCALLRVTPISGPSGGHRAEHRRRWARGGLGALADGGLRRLAALARPLLDDRRRAGLAARLERAGDPLGLCAEELPVVAVLGAVLGAALGAALGPLFEARLPGALAGLTLGALLPGARVAATAEHRVRAADRELPAAIDLVGMCMAAGLDFTRAVGLVADNPIAGSVLPEELRRVLGDVRLGSTRRSALEALARRLPSRGVCDFVAAAVQAERKGTPLSLVLETQAGLSRMRRSVAAEEAASRAGVLLLLPLMMLMGCIVLLLVGPFVAGARP